MAKYEDGSYGSAAGIALLAEGVDRNLLAAVR